MVPRLCIFLRCRSRGATSSCWAPFLAPPRPEQTTVTRGFGPHLRSILGLLSLKASMPREGQQAVGGGVDHGILSWPEGKGRGSWPIQIWRKDRSQGSQEECPFLIPTSHSGLKASSQEGSSDPHSWPLAFPPPLASFLPLPKPCPFSPPNTILPACFSVSWQSPHHHFTEEETKAGRRWETAHSHRGCGHLGEDPRLRDAFPVDIRSFIYFTNFL